MKLEINYDVRAITKWVQLLEEFEFKFEFYELSIPSLSCRKIFLQMIIDSCIYRSSSKNTVVDISHFVYLHVVCK